jgi:uncharacterized protein (TIGR02246 family)
MRVAFISLMFLALAAAAPAQQPRRPRATASASQSNMEEDKKAIAELQRRDIEANIAVDTEKLLALRTDDVVYLVPGRPPLVGKDAVRKYLEGIREELANWDMVGYEENWQEVQVVGEYAFEWGTVNIRAQKDGQRQESAAVRNVVQGLKRQPDGSWKIARVIWNLQAPQPAPPSAPAKPKE